jgi:hypothetical protein
MDNGRRSGFFLFFDEWPINNGENLNAYYVRMKCGTWMEASG